MPRDEPPTMSTGPL